jgi:hypothetical protein
MNQPYLFKNKVKSVLQNWISRVLLLLLISIFLYGIIIGNYTTNNQFSVCIFKNILGIPCPGCGLTHATISFWQGHWKEATQFHILAIPINLGLALYFLYKVFKNKLQWTKFQNFTKKIPNILLAVVAIVIFVATYSFQLYKFFKLIK